MSTAAIPLAYRNDGFSLYFIAEPPMTPDYLAAHYIDPLVHSSIKALIWGIGPGAGVFTYNTELGEIYGDRLTERQWRMCRPRDRWVNANVHALIEEVECPLRTVAQRAHEHGMEVYGRYPMQRGYAPLDKWMGVVFTGEFPRQHPEYWIPGTSCFLDFKHEEVRNFKLGIIREVVSAGFDGIFMDFCTKAGPFFERPDGEVMTGFMRDCRSMFEEIRCREGRDLRIWVRIPARGATALGLDWRTWMREQLVDCLVPSFAEAGPGKMGYEFCVSRDRFVELGKETGCKVYGFIWHDLGLVSHDPAPDGRMRYAKPITREMLQAQALLHHRSGVDGIQLAWGWGDELSYRPWAADLADPGKLSIADKHYMVDVGPHIPVRFPLPAEAPLVSEADVPLRIADDLSEARCEGHHATATLIFHSRGLKAGEKLAIHVNDNGLIEIAGGSAEETGKEPPVEWKVKERGALIGEGPWIFEPNWWKRGEHRVVVPPEWLRTGDNTIRMRYSAGSHDVEPPYWVSWIDLRLDYDGPVSVADRMAGLYRGPRVGEAATISAYTGRQAADVIAGEDRRKACLLNYEQLEINYGNNVELQLRREQVILCPQTVHFLYDGFTPSAVRYVPGSRPVLEQIVRETTAGCDTDADRALALMRFCRDLYKKRSWHKRGLEDYVYGGTEEQLVDKGEQLCECLGRLHVALCEVAGIPGRIVMHDIGGHICSEVRVDGQWAYMDPRCGVYCLKPDGSLASVWELWNDPRLLRDQPDEVMADASERWKWEFRVWKCQAMYFDPREINGFQNYSLADADKYGYEQLTAQQVENRGLWEINKTYRQTIDAVFGTSEAMRTYEAVRRARARESGQSSGGSSVKGAAKPG